MIEENGHNSAANQKKGTEIQNYFRMQIEQFEHLEQPQIRFETNRKFESFLSLSINT
jgi:hypothetical protein